jgi:hypothetical protein
MNIVVYSVVVTNFFWLTTYVALGPSCCRTISTVAYFLQRVGCCCCCCCLLDGMHIYMYIYIYIVKDCVATRIILVILQRCLPFPISSSSSSVLVLPPPKKRLLLVYVGLFPLHPQFLESENPSQKVDCMNVDKSFENRSSR